MNPLRVLLSVVIAATILIPTAVASSGTGTLEFQSPQNAELQLEAVITGTEARDLRTSMDNEEAGGNGDGTVSAQEVTQFEQATVTLFNQFGADAVGAVGGVEMDGKGIDRFEVKVLDFQGAEGAVANTNPIEADLVASLHFPVTAGSRHTLTGEAPDDRDGESPIASNVSGFTLKAPSSYVIDSTKGLPSGASVSSDKRQIVFQGDMTPEGELEIVFTKSAKKSPGPAAVFGLIAVVVAASVWSRRR